MIVFLENALGFFIQLFPCALMIFLPFPREAYRFGRRTIIFGMMIVSAVMASLFSVALCLRDINKYPLHIILSNLSMFAAILFVLAAYISLVRESLLKKLMVFFIVLFYAASEFVLVNVIHSFIYPGLPDTTAYPYTPSFLLLYAASTALLLPLMLAVVIRPLKEYIRIIEPQNMKREFFSGSFSTFMYFVLMSYCDTLYGKTGFFYLDLPLLLFLTINQIFIYWLIFRECVRRERDNEKRRTMEIQQLQYEKIIDEMENTRRMHHDLHHHYNTLNDMLDRGKTDEMKAYLSDIINTTVYRDSEVYCKNITVGGLLQYYVGLARDEGIRCKVRAECGELGIEPVDLTVLFGNAMENAIDACKKCTKNRWICIQVGMIQDSFAVEISNSCSEVHLNRGYKTENGFLPAEAFSSGRADIGYGLQSIDHTAKKYDGSAGFRFDSDKETFTARIRLNTHREI